MNVLNAHTARKKLVTADSSMIFIAVSMGNREFVITTMQNPADGGKKVKKVSKVQF